MLFFSKIFSFIQSAVKQTGKVASQARLDSVFSASMGGLAFAVSNENWDELGKSISQSMGR